jgi:hypothetical protein
VLLRIIGWSGRRRRRLAIAAGICYGAGLIVLLSTIYKGKQPAWASLFSWVTLGIAVLLVLLGFA